MRSLPHWRAAFARPRSCVLAALLGVASLPGCVSYAPKPLHRAEWITALEGRSKQVPDNTSGGTQTTAASGAQINLREAEKLALVFNPSLRAARRKAQIPVLSATQAGLWEDPEFGADVMRVLKPEPLQKSWITGASLSFTIPVSGRLAVEKAKATAEGQAALAEVFTEEQEKLRELREAWIQMSAGRRNLSTSSALLARLEEVVAITNRLEKAGELVTAEAVAFRLAAVRVRLERDKTAAEVAEAEREVIALVGLLPGAPIKLSDEEQDSVGTALPGHDVLLARNPLVLQREAEYAAAEEALRLEVRRQYPDVKLGPAWSQEDGQDQLGVGFSIPIPILNANRRGIVEASAAREAARAAWEESVQNALGDFERAKAVLAFAENRRRSIAEDAQPLATKQFEEAKRLADAGEMNALLLLNAIEVQREASADLIQAEADVELARVRLAALAPEGAPPPEPDSLTKGPNK